MSSEKFDRFDLEQAILSCWGITDDIRLLSKSDNTEAMDYEALARLYEFKFEQCFKIFENFGELK